MVELGEKIKNNVNDMYPHSVSDKADEEKIQHMPLRLPLKILEDKGIKKGDRICVRIEGEVTEIMDGEYSEHLVMKCEKGEVEDGAREEKKEKEEEGTYLGGKGE